MNPTLDDVKRAVDVAKSLEAQGYFTKVKQGDEKAASYFSRMVASKVNPSGNPNDWGWLSKPAGGFNIEGFADGAIVFGNNPSDLNNVLKIVVQVGSSNPNDIKIGDSVQQRRPQDVWFCPVPLPDSVVSYITGQAPTPAFPSYEVDFGGDKLATEQIGIPLESDYIKAGQRLNSGSATWFARTYYDAVYFTVVDKMNAKDAMAKSVVKRRPEWRKALDPLGTIPWDK